VGGRECTKEAREEGREVSRVLGSEREEDAWVFMKLEPSLGLKRERKVSDPGEARASVVMGQVAELG
jgi:hypothetical protein